jgi:multicomponent Na+:H+ antiporter subunit D
VVGFVFGPALMRDLGLDSVLAVFAVVTIIAASLLAFRQDNLKLRLAYSTVGHLSYIVLGATLLSTGALTGSVLHLAFHATLKITLFFCAGAIYVNLHRENISELDGVGRVMPWTMGAFTAAAIGLSGVPPLNGFVSKWWLGWGAIEAGNVLPVAVLALSGLLNAGYLLPIAGRAFLRPAKGLAGKGEASPLMVAPVLLAAVVSLLFGLVPNLVFRFFDLARAVAAGILGGAGQ